MRDPIKLCGLPESSETPLGHGIFGYKHWFPDVQKLRDPRQVRTLFVVLYRDPLTWIKAMMDRPYALERSIGGRRVDELPQIRLVGHIRGKDTQNEFDPVTGDPLTIFELRGRKIAHFESLKSQVDNVAFVALEELLTDREAVLRRLAAAFPSVFSPRPELARLPFGQLLDDFERARPFNEQEETVLMGALDWKVEESIGYTPHGHGPSDARKADVVILHGASGIGKSYQMIRLAALGDNRLALEMDDCEYWTEWTPEFRQEALFALCPFASARDRQDFLTLVETAKPKAKRCIDFLARRLGEILVSQREVAGHPLVIATCGALPNPADLGSMSVYRWLADRAPVKFHHLLLDVPDHVHLARIERRGRGRISEEILKQQNRKSSNRGAFDAVVQGLSEAAAYVATIQQSPALPEIDTFAHSRPRIYRKALEYIQIYGERNSGTKFLTRFIADLAVNPENVLGAYATKTDPVNRARLIGYKHYYPRLDRVEKYQDRTLFLVIYKNPYTWIRSMLSRPYHFQASLEGKGIADLPFTRLFGVDVHGTAIPDVHPETGRNLTLFELRRHKILKWEELRTIATNVAYVNYEDLLVAPTDILQKVADNFPHLFRGSIVPDHHVDKQYLEKYLSPEAFDDADMAVMNAHIDWSVEATIGYRVNSLFVG
jgi:hypothetical protein